MTSLVRQLKTYDGWLKYIEKDGELSEHKADNFTSSQQMTSYIGTKVTETELERDLQIAVSR